MVASASKLRRLWKHYDCKDSEMVVVPFGPDRIRIAPETAPAWQALAAILAHHGYALRSADTDSYNCRNKKGSNKKSLHAFGVALDINATTNPWIDHAGTRKVRFSNKPSQSERAEDVRLGRADTDFTPAIIRDVLAVRTKAGKSVFEWGGNAKAAKDSMHFEIELGPQDLAAGIDTGTVAGWDTFLRAARPAPDDDQAAYRTPGAEEAAAYPGIGPARSIARPTQQYIVNARDGLNMRAGPGVAFPVISNLAFGTPLYILTREDAWVQVDLQGDGAADGFVHGSYLVPAGEEPGTPADIIDRVTPAMVKSIFPPATRLTNITNNLPFVLAGLKSRALGDKPMVLMALATIRAETEGFVPISEGISQYNTRDTPFDLYEPGTPAGTRLGNTQRGDGPRFKGRGFVQLTGRDNYTRIGPQVGAQLAANPELANDPTTAGHILGQFLKNKEREIRNALRDGDLPRARKLVNGGSHGLDRFTDTYNRGLSVLPG